MITTKLMAISCAVGVTLGITIATISSQSQQKELASIEHNPQVYEIGIHADCNLQYIRTSHPEAAGIPDIIYKEDVYLKSTCDDSTSITKVKEKISFNRMKLLSENEVGIKKPKM